MKQVKRFILSGANSKNKNNMKANELNKMLVKLAVISQKSLFRQSVRESIKKGKPYIQLALNAQNNYTNK